MQRSRGGARVRVISALLDGVPVSEDAALPLGDRGVLLGDSVFETMRAYGGRVFALDAHLDRLERSAAWARITIGASRDELREEIAAAAAAHREDAAVRIFILRGARTSGRLADSPTRRLVVLETLALDESLYVRGARACVLPHEDFGTADGAHAKYARYLPRLLARDEAAARGCEEALLADTTGRIVEAATGSVFAVVDGVIMTASILEGITRAAVLRLARDRKMSATLGPIEARDLARASEAFVTSSLRELVPVVHIDERVVGDGSPGPVAKELLAALRVAARAII